MRAGIIVFVVLVALVKPMNGSLYGEKETAIEQVEKKYVEVAERSLQVFDEVVSEESKREKGAEDETRKFLESELNKFNYDYGMESNSTVRYGIAYNHRMNCIRCIISVKIQGDNSIAQHYADFKREIDNVPKNKLKQLKERELELYTVGNAAKQLKRQKIYEINHENDYDKRKREALDDLTISIKMLNEIEKDIPKANLFKEYSKIKDKISSKFAEIKTYYFKHLNKCLQDF